MGEGGVGRVGGSKGRKEMGWRTRYLIHLDKIRQWITDVIFNTETDVCVTQNQGPRFTYKHGKNKMNQSLQV